MIHFQFQTEVDRANLAHVSERRHIVQRNITFNHTNALILLIDGGDS